MTLDGTQGGAAQNSNPVGSDQSASGSASPNSNQQSTTDWTAALAPEMKNVITAKGWKTPADVLNGYVQVEKAVGADKVVVPKDGVWDEASRTRLGIPKDAAGYTVKRPENLPQGLPYDENFEKAALGVAHKAGLLPTQVQALIEFYTGYQGEQFNAVRATMHKEAEAASGALKSEWGAAFDSKVSLAGRAAKHFGGQALVDVLNQSGLGNNPELVRAFAKVGALMGEDTLKSGTSGGFNLTPVEARREANKLMQHPDYTSKDPVTRQAAVEKVQALFEQAARE